MLTYKADCDQLSASCAARFVTKQTLRSVHRMQSKLFVPKLTSRVGLVQKVRVSGASEDQSPCNVAKLFTAVDIVGQSISIWW